MSFPGTLAKAYDPDRAMRSARAKEYPKQALYLVATAIALVSICHFASILNTLYRKPSKSRKDPKGKISYTRLPLAVLNAFRIVAYRCTLRFGKSYNINVAEIFITIVYIVALFCWTMAKSTNTLGQRGDPKYYANIAGAIAASQMPVITALGTKNNPISFLTGIRYDKLNYLHRMSARVICVLIWVHAGGRLKLGLHGNDGLSETWIRLGFLAASALTLLCILSVRPLRERSYELFVVTHFILVLIILVSAYVHASDQRVGRYVYPSFIIWGLDRFLHFLRIFAYNLGYFRSKAVRETMDATVDMLSPHFVRLTVRRPRYFHWLPGQSAFLILPKVSTFPFEGHPFTISTIEAQFDDHDEKITTTNEKIPDSASSSEDSCIMAGGKELVFIIRVRAGFTKKLLNVASDDNRVKILVDGPYGSPPLLKGFDTVIFVAGGSGITFTLPLFLDLLHRGKTRSFDCTRIVFVWVVRELDHINWIARQLRQALDNLPPFVTIVVHLYITSTPENGDVESGDNVSIETAKTEPINLRSLPFVQSQHGRPDLKAFFRQELSEAVGAMSVNVCGPLGLADDVRTALRDPHQPLNVLKGGPSVTLHVESF